MPEKSVYSRAIYNLYVYTYRCSMSMFFFLCLFRSYYFSLLLSLFFPVFCGSYALDQYVCYFIFIFQRNTCLCARIFFCWCCAISSILSSKFSLHYSKNTSFSFIWRCSSIVYILINLVVESQKYSLENDHGNDE